MLKIFNDLEPFLWDNYRRIGVREYAKLRKVSPPTASTMLSALHREGLLRKEKERTYLFFSANDRSQLFLQLSHAYFTQHFERVGLTKQLERELINPLIIMFGSFAKAEINENSDIDIAIFSPSDRDISVKKHEEQLGRSIQVFMFRNKEAVKNKDLLNNILNGVIISGEWHHGL